MKGRAAAPMGSGCKGRGMRGEPAHARGQRACNVAAGANTQRPLAARTPAPRQAGGVL